MISLSNTRQGLVILLFVILGFLIYSNTVKSPFYFDDVPNIRRNPNIRLTRLTFKDIRKAAFESPCPNRPIANVSFALNYYVHKYNVVGYHVTNIIIHILTGIFLYLLLKTTLCISTKKWDQSLNPPIPQSLNPPIISFFSALLWLVHPIHTQSVTYVVQRMNSMAAMFYVLSFLLYVRGRLVTENQKSWPWLAGCALAGMLALGSKEIAATLPFFILLYEWYFFQNLSTAWLKRHLPYIIGALILLGVLTFVYFGTNPLQGLLSGYRHRGFTLTERALTQFRVVVYYIVLLVYPHPSRLNLDHDFPLSHSLIDPITTLLSMGAIIGAVGLAIYIAKKEPLLSFCMLWFLGNLAIESSVIGLEIIFEHRTYLPSMFLLTGIVVLACRLVKRKWPIVAILSPCVILLCLGTYERNNIWSDPLNFSEDSAQKAPDKARPQNTAGAVLLGEGKYSEAIAHFRKALQIDPHFAPAYNNLGLALAQEGKVDEAIFHYTRALQLRPGDATAHYGLGIVFSQKGELNKALEHFSEAVRIDPDHGKAHNRLGHALAERGELAKAIAHFSEAVRIQPDSENAHYNLAVALAGRGKADEAISHYRKALKLDPEYAEAHNNLGISLAGQGKLEEAIAHFSEAVRIRPDFSEAKNNLRRALAYSAGT